jgi:nucleotide-binding universal stress UspA family protein
MTDTTAAHGRITFGDDGSAGADTAWGWVTAQRWPGWTVDVIRVSDPDPRLESLYMHDPLHEIADPENPRTAPADVGLAGIRHLTTAFDRRVILEESEGDLLIVGARGRGVLKSMHLGSTVEWLMRTPRTPLVVARQAEPVRGVVACVDGSAHADTAVDVLARMPWLAGVTVSVLTVTDDEESAGDAVERAVARLAGAGATATAVAVPRASTGGVKGTLLAAVEERDPDLVVLGTRGRTGLVRAVVGSVAGAVAQQVTCSVLLAHAG